MYYYGIGKNDNPCIFFLLYFCELKACVIFYLCNTVLWFLVLCRVVPHWSMGINTYDTTRDPILAVMPSWAGAACSVPCHFRNQHSIGTHDDVIKWKHLRYWPFVRGIHRTPVNSPHTGHWRGALAQDILVNISTGNGLLGTNPLPEPMWTYYWLDL